MADPLGPGLRKEPGPLWRRIEIEFDSVFFFHFPAVYGFYFLDVKPKSSNFSADFWGLLFLFVLQVLRPAAPLFSPSVQHLSVCVNMTHHDEDVGAPQEEKEEEEIKSSLELRLRLTHFFIFQKTCRRLFVSPPPPPPPHQQPFFFCCFFFIFCVAAAPATPAGDSTRT